MAFNLFGGKRRITKGFFANSLGNKQTRGIYTFQIDVENEIGRASCRERV